MDVKDSRSEASVGDRNDGNTKFAQGGSALQCQRNKTYQDIGSNSFGKVDPATTRPCAVIGPDRVVPPPVPPEPYLKKGPAEPWPGTEPAYRRPPDYPHKLLDYQHPTRNISPRQTFQENMQRIMVPPTYNSVKLKEDHNIPGDPNLTQMRNKLDVPTESNSKYCDVPYNVNPILNEQKAVRNPDLSVSNMNSVLTRSTHHGWPPASATVRPSKPYPPELCQYLEYPSCAGPRPIVMQRPHRTVHEEPGPVYPEAYYHDGNIRYKPYPSVKDRFPQARYDYISNYPNSFHPLPPFPTHKYDVQKPMPPHPYPAYSQVPIKYLDGRMVDPVMNGYQRSLNPQGNYNNVAYCNQMMHPSYGPVPSNCVQTNKFYPYPPDAAKSMTPNKVPYADPNNKTYAAEYENRLKSLPSSENYYVNDITRMHHMKAPGLSSGYPPAIPGMSTYPYYRKDTIKGYEYNPQFRNLNPMLNMNGSLVPRFPSHFSPNSIAVSPSDSNISNDTNLTLGTSHDDFGYVSQTSSARSSDSAINRMPHEYQRYNHRYSPIVKPTLSSSKNEHTSSSSKDKKEIDVRQFLQMWNEGEEESVGNTRDAVSKTVPNSISGNTNVTHFETSSQEQLYVLGLVNVPSEELAKYEHIQKVSKLPENIKGYNNIELLHQFEEIVESSNLGNYTAKLPMSKDFHTPLKGMPMHHSISIQARPLSPLDVEAKISQSVIHKDVGCNFEIKPCSPKMMNVEIAAPVQSVMDERIIEKVSNPLLVASRTTHCGNEIRDECNVIKCPDSISASVASCKMISSPYSRNDNIDPSKTNYSIQDLECNSGVCLASLPRLDNDIELNFPEVNQQFINANKVETVITSTSMNDSSRLGVEQCEMSDCKFESDIDSAASNNPTDKDISKLSKYRKLKRKGSDSIASESSVQAQRTDSVIIKNPENLKKDKDIENYQNIENCPDKSINLSPLNSFDEAQNDPINLTVSTDYRESSSVISEGTEQQLVQKERMETAVDFSTRSNENNDVNTCEPESSSSFNNEQPEYQNDLLVKENELDVKSKPSDDSENIRSILEDKNNGTSKLFEEIELNTNAQPICRDPSDDPKKKRKRRSTSTKSRYDKLSRITLEGPTLQPLEGEHIQQPQSSEFSAPDVEDSINVKMRELFGELSGAETLTSANSPDGNSHTINSDDEMLATKMSALHEDVSNTQLSQTKNINEMKDKNLSQMPKEGGNTKTIFSTQMTPHNNPKIESKVSFSDTDLQSSTEVISAQSSVSPSCVIKVNNDDYVMLSSKNSLHNYKALLSPWIQKLIIHTEGFCANSIQHCLLNDVHSKSSKPLIDDVGAEIIETNQIKRKELESNNYSQVENKILTEENPIRVKAQDEKQEFDSNTVLMDNSPSDQTTSKKSVSGLEKYGDMENVTLEVCLTKASQEQDLPIPVINSVPHQMETENYVIKSKDTDNIKKYTQLTSAGLSSPLSEGSIGLEADTSCSGSRCQSKVLPTDSEIENFEDRSEKDNEIFSPYNKDVLDKDYIQKSVGNSPVPASDLKYESTEIDKCEDMLVDEPAKSSPMSEGSIGLEAFQLNTSCSGSLCQSKVSPTDNEKDNFEDRSDKDSKIFSSYNKDVLDKDYTQKSVEYSPVPASDLKYESTEIDKCKDMLVDDPAKRVTLPCDEIMILDTTLDESMNDNFVTDKIAAEDYCSNKDSPCLPEKELIQSNTDGDSEDLPYEVVAGCIQNTCVASDDSHTNTEPVFDSSVTAGKENITSFKIQPNFTCAERCYKDSNDLGDEENKTQTKQETVRADVTDTPVVGVSTFTENTLQSNTKEFNDTKGENTFSFKNELVHTASERSLENSTDIDVVANTCLSKSEPTQANTDGGCEMGLTNTENCSEDLKNCSPENELFETKSSECLNGVNVTAAKNVIDLSKNIPVQATGNGNYEDPADCIAIKENNLDEECEDTSDSTAGSCVLLKENTCLSENVQVQRSTEECFEKLTVDSSSSTEENTCLSKNGPFQLNTKNYGEISTTASEGNSSSFMENNSFSGNEPVQSHIDNDSEDSTDTTSGSTTSCTTGNTCLSDTELVQPYIERCCADSIESTARSSSFGKGNTSSSGNESVQSYIEGYSEVSTETIAGRSSPKINTSLSKKEPIESYIEGNSEDCTEITARGVRTTTENISFSDNEPVQSQIKEYGESLTEASAEDTTAKRHSSLFKNESVPSYIEEGCENFTENTVEGFCSISGNTSASENEPVQSYIEGHCEGSTGSSSTSGNTCSSENELVLGYCEDSTNTNAERSSTINESNCLSEKLLDQPNGSGYDEDTIIDPDTISSTNTYIAQNCNQIEKEVSLCFEETDQRAHSAGSSDPENTDIHKNEMIEPDDKNCPTRAAIINHDILSSDNNRDHSVGFVKHTIQDSSINGNKYDSALKLIETEESCPGMAIINNLVCEDQTENIAENSPYRQNYVIRKRRNLKRSLSDTALDKIRENDEALFHSFMRPSKRSNILKREQETSLLAENICQVIQNHRRNSISSVQNEENVSFCILIDNDCIITDELSESDKICFSEVPENCIACIQDEPLNDDVTSGEILTLQEEVNCCEYPTGFDGNLDEEKSVEPWLEDVACVETVVSDDIAENIVISATASPTDLDSEDEYREEEKESYVNEHINEQSCVYSGDKIRTEYNRIDDPLYQSPPRNVDYAMNTIESFIVESYSGHYDTKYSQDILLGSAIQEEASKNSMGFECTSPMSMSSNETVNNSPNRENIELDSYISNTESISILKSKTENCVSPLTELWNEKEETKILETSPKMNTINFVSEISPSIRDNFSSKKSEDSRCAISSSPEVSSTTSEEKNTSILLKITNYSGSRVSQVTDSCPVNSISCKYTEKRDYLSSNGKQCLNPKRTLITKAAQKYIPPLKETIPNLKVKLPLPPSSLLKLKQIKMAKATPKLNEDKSVALKSFRQEGPKKPKPKFEDVLKSIEEIQYQKHKENSKKIRKSIPKVVIKKSENGSHYASTSCKDNHGPDLTGRKWQPWVFLERNHFLDKMALKRKTRAIFSHRKNCYVLAEKFYKYKSVGTNNKFVISQPLAQSSTGRLKYTIRLKNQY